MAADRGRIKTAISMHSYSQMFLSPYGYTTDLPVEYPEMVRCKCSRHTKDFESIFTFHFLNVSFVPWKSL